MPDLVRPMLATPGEMPPDGRDASFAYEMKWDGVRAVVYVDGGRVRAMTRNDLEVSATYPELRELGRVCQFMGGATAAHDARRLRCRTLERRPACLRADALPSHALDDADIHQQLPDTP